MSYFLFFFFSCLVTYEDTTDRTAVTFEQGETTKALSSRTPVQSSAKIAIFDKDAMLGHGSGNYFKIGTHRFIVTAAHVVGHKYESYVLDGDEFVKLTTLYLDKERDVAIVVPEKHLSKIVAKNFRVNHKFDLLGKTIYYAGFPQDLEKCLFKGFVSKSLENSLIMQGFALPGSSGSVVFDFWGRAIGVVSAVKVSYSNISPFPEMVESIVIVERISHFDRDFIKGLFDEGTGTL